MEANRDEERLRTRIKVAIMEADADTRQLVCEVVAQNPNLTAEAGDDAPHGKVIAAFSPKGGVGTTTLAVNLACALTTFGRRVVIVDGNVGFGNVGMFLNITPGRNILHVVDDLGGILEAHIDDALHTHPSGLKVLLAPDKAEDSDTIHGEHLRTILANLQARYDYVVVDTWP